MGLIPGTYILNWTITNGLFCTPSVDDLVIAINSPATVFAGPNDTICEGSNYLLSNATSTNAASVHWTTSGTGMFNDSYDLNPVYTPSPNDILDGYVVLTLNTNTGSSCPNTAGSMTLYISHSAVIDAGPDATICETDGTFIINASASQYATNYQWSSSGTGAFLNGTSLHPMYIPSPDDITTGMVILTVTAGSSLPCTDVTDAMILTINHQAIVSAGGDASICESDTYSLLSANAINGNSYLWTTSGTGTFNDNTLLNPEYTPSMNDILDGYVNLTLTVTSTSPCSNVSDMMTLFINHQAVMNAGPDAAICETQGGYLISSSSSQNVINYQWNTTGSGVFSNPNTLHPVYTPSPADISAGSVILTVTANSTFPCANVTDTMILTINHQAVISAGSDNTICETGTYTINDATAQNASSLHWTTTGTGTFSNGNSLSPVYTPSQNDIIDGFVYLLLNATSASPCAAVTDTMILTIMHQANNVFAGNDATICETDTYFIGDATENNASSLLWTTSGTGTFDNTALLHPVYSPSPADIAMGSVVLTMTASSAAPCISVSDNMTLSFSLHASSTAGPDDIVCEGLSYILSGATANNASGYVWSTNGSGTFTDPSVLNAEYNPSAADILNGQIVLTLTALSVAPCGNAPSDAMTLTISHKPVINAGPDTAICQNASYFVDEATALYSTSLFWTTNGTGTVLNGTTLNPTYIPGPGETGAVMMTMNAVSSFVCGSDTTTDFMYLTIKQSVVANAGQDTSIFANNSVALHGSATFGSGAYSYNWQPANLVIFENTDHPVTEALSATTVFTVTVTDLVTGCQDMDSVVVTVNGINLPPVAVDDYDTTEYETCLTFPVLLNDFDPENTALTVSLCGPPLHGLVVINSDNTLTYCPYKEFNGDDTLCYRICDHGSPVNCAQATVYIHVKPQFTLDDLVIYNAVSPNGDGDNDVWIIDGIQFFPDNEVTIFNRWGDEVANYTHYNNKDIAWDATYKGKTVPDGTYYYILDIKNKKKFAGWVYVKTGK
jgi:gliding motility-associated-like protein